jgi:hypothetical protein
MNRCGLHGIPLSSLRFCTHKYRLVTTQTQTPPLHYDLEIEVIELKDEMCKTLCKNQMKYQVDLIHEFVCTGTTDMNDPYFLHCTCTSEQYSQWIKTDLVYLIKNIREHVIYHKILIDTWDLIDVVRQNLLLENTGIIEPLCEIIMGYMGSNKLINRENEPNIRYDPNDPSEFFSNDQCAETYMYFENESEYRIYMFINHRFITCNGENMTNLSKCDIGMDWRLERQGFLMVS